METSLNVISVTDGGGGAVDYGFARNNYQNVLLDWMDVISEGKTDIKGNSSVLA